MAGKTIRGTQKQNMTNTENDFPCPHCAKLWDRIETLEKEKAKAEEERAKVQEKKTKADWQMSLLFPIIILWAVLSAASLLIRLFTL